MQKANMLPSTKPPLILPLLFFLTLLVSAHITLAQNSELTARKVRFLLGIKETPNGGNVTFDCSPSGPCIPCSRSEKKDKKYRCGETGYRIRLKCAPPGVGSKDSKSTRQEERSTLELTESDVVNQHGDRRISPTRQRRLLSNSSKGAPRAYITYRSCIPAVNEEKLSVFGFETLMLGLLLSSGSFIYFRRKRAAVPGGVPVRLPTSSRF